MGIRGEIYSTKINTSKRTYFFNLKENRQGDLFINLVESKKNEAERFERHSVMIFEEDFKEFFASIRKVERTIENIEKEKKGKRDSSF